MDRLRVKPVVKITGEIYLTLTLIEDTNFHHLGDEFRSDFVMKSPEGRERTYTFGLSGRPISGRVEIRVHDMDLIGAEVLVNGALIMSLPPPTGSGDQSEPIPVVNLLVGQNTLTVRARADGASVEDFEYSRLVVSVTIET